MHAESRIYVAGGETFVGQALRRRLDEQGFSNLIGEPAGLDLRNAASVDAFFASARPEYVFVVAGLTAGIAGNQQAPADLMLDNLRIASHVIPAAWTHHARKLLYLASSCTYPKNAPHPLHVSSLWSGAVEDTSAAYAVAKLAGMKLCDAFRAQHGAAFVNAIAADAYGPGDDFDPAHSHVVSGLMRRVHDAKAAGAATVEVWGTGAPEREFIFVEDLADACLFAMERYDDAPPVNLGVGRSTPIRELAERLRDAVGYRGELRFDTTRPDGMPFKGLDSAVLHGMGWRARVDLVTGLRRTYEWFLKERA